MVREVNWLIPEDEVKILEGQELTAKFRHRQKEVAIKIVFQNKNFDTAKVLCGSLVRALTPGQYAVLYKGNICLGGGAVFQTEKLNEQVCPF